MNDVDSLTAHVSQPMIYAPGGGMRMWNPGNSGSVTTRSTLIFEMSTIPVDFWRRRYGMKLRAFIWPVTIVTL